MIRSLRHGSGGGGRAGELAVRRTARTVAVASTPADARRLSRLLRHAAQALRQVTGPGHSELVAYWPSSRDSFDSLIGAAAGSYDAIAAVTTTIVDDRGGSTVAVVVNPDVFTTLRPLGRRVVMAHEATHAATVGGAAAMPVWLAEGFAEYVAIGGVDVAVVRSLRAAVREVRRNGVPRRLPSEAAFDATAPHLNATYAQSWLAVRLLVQRYGEQRLMACYDAVAADPAGLRAALRDELGTTLTDITALWRQQLTGLADGG